MKRTKTFVMKFLSLFALCALVLTSCTKDLEDRIDKVEGDLATITKTVKELQDKLAAIEGTIPTDALTKIAELTERIKTLEEMPAGMTDAQITAAIAAAKSELTTTINALPKISHTTNAAGNIELTFITNGKTEVLTFVGPESVTVTKDPATNTTTVKVGGKSFSFPTNIVIPSSVTGIVLATDVTAGFSLEQDAIFKLTISLNTNDAEPVALTAQNLVITNAYDTRGSIYEATTNMTITKVTAIDGAVNEFDVEVKVKKVAPKAAYRLGVKISETNVVRSENQFNVTIKNFSPIATAKVKIIDTETAVAYTPNFGTVKVDNNTPSLTKQIEFTYFNATPNDITSSTEHFMVYSNLITGATSVDDAIGKAGFKDVNQFFTGNTAVVAPFTTAFDALRANTAYPNAPTFANMISDPTAANGVKLNITPTYDQTKLVKHYYFVSIVAQSKYDGQLIRNYGVVEVDMQSNKNFTVAPTTLESVATLTYTVRDALGDSYVKLTEKSNLNSNVNTITITKAGVSVPLGKTKFTADPALSGDSRLGYTVQLDPALSDGVYTVVITVNYGTNKNLVITQNVTIQCPAITFAATTPAVTGYESNGTFNSIKVTPLGFNYTFASHITATVPGYTVTTDYKIFYRVKSGAIYLDGVKDEGLATTYTFAGTPATTITAQQEEVIATTDSTAQRIAYDKVYSVEAYVVFSSGHTITRPTGLTIKYATGAPVISGFLKTDETTFITNLAYPLDRATATTINLSYVKGATKPFYFSNATGANIYLEKDDTKVLAKSVDYISNIAYKVLPVTYDATKMTVTGATAGDAYTFVAFSDNDTKADHAAITTEAFNAKYAFTKIDAATGTAITAVKVPFIQPIEVKVTDIWNRVATLTINVTISEPAPAPSR